MGVTGVVTLGQLPTFATVRRQLRIVGDTEALTDVVETE